MPLDATLFPRALTWHGVCFIGGNMKHSQNKLQETVARSLSQFTVDAGYSAIYPHNNHSAARKVIRDLEAAGYRIIRTRAKGKTLVKLAEEGKL